MNVLWSNPDKKPRYLIDDNITIVYMNNWIKTDFNNDCSIFLIDTIGKTFVGIICEQLIKFTNHNRPSRRFNLRSNFSTVVATESMIYIVQNDLDTNQELVPKL